MHRKNIILVSILVASLFGLLVFIHQRNFVSDALVGDSFREDGIELPLYELYDVGAADINLDGFYDFFTVNHSARQSILINKGSGVFENQVDEIGLSQDSEYNNIENRGYAPDMKIPGLYLYRQDKQLHIKSHDLNQSVSAVLSLPWPISIVKNLGAEVSFSVSDSYEITVDNSKLEFALAGGGELVVVGAQNILELPHNFELGIEIPLEHVFLGHSLINPQARSFTLSWRDRHAMSWADVNGDDLMDVFISRGGVKGQLNSVAVNIEDELMISDNGVLKINAASIAFQKGNCPARQSAWVDHDNNGLLDIYISCGRGRLPGFKNLILSQVVAGEFVNVAADYELDFGRISVFRWVDFDLDGDMDLLSVDDNQLVYYSNTGTSYDKSVLVGNLVSDFVQIQVSDFDNDGDFDAYVVSRIESMIVLNESGEFSIRSPDTFGLPTGGRSANWIDYDNDGLVDLHSVPGGLYKQGVNGQFSSTGLLSDGKGIHEISQARCNWIDFENNGTLDVVCATQRNYSKEVRFIKKIIDKNAEIRFWHANQYTNLLTGNNWLHVDLIGTEGNRQGIGAIVEVVVDGVSQLRAIGANDGAHYSQGNYRASFGLANFDSVNLVKVTWPDGSKTVLNNVDVNRVLKVRK